MKKIITTLFIFLIVAVWFFSNRFQIWQALADYQGANIPAGAENDSSFGMIPWSNPTNVFSSDNQSAIASFSLRTDNSYYLKATKFGFSIPSGSKIDGILVEVERRTDLRARDAEVRIVKAGAIGGQNKADRNTPWPLSDTSKSYGGANDVWGLEPWSADDINADDFGVAIAVQGIQLGRRFPNAYIDNIRITVYYTPPPQPAFWKEAEDTRIIGVNKNENIRLRIEVVNRGAEATADYRLEYALKDGTDCGDGNESFDPVPGTASDKDFKMADSPYFTDGDTTPHLATPDSYTFVTGRMVESPSNSSGNLILPFESYTEIEFVFQATNNATNGVSYCFRLTNAGTSLDNYQVYPELQISP